MHGFTLDLSRFKIVVGQDTHNSSFGWVLKVSGPSVPFGTHRKMLPSVNGRKTGC